MGSIRFVRAAPRIILAPLAYVAFIAVVAAATGWLSDTRSDPIGARWITGVAIMGGALLQFIVLVRAAGERGLVGGSFLRTAVVVIGIAGVVWLSMVISLLVMVWLWEWRGLCCFM